MSNWLPPLFEAVSPPPAGFRSLRGSKWLSWVWSCKLCLGSFFHRLLRSVFPQYWKSWTTDASELNKRCLCCCQIGRCVLIEAGALSGVTWWARAKETSCVAAEKLRSPAADFRLQQTDHRHIQDLMHLHDEPREGNVVETSHLTVNVPSNQIHKPGLQYMSRQAPWNQNRESRCTLSVQRTTAGTRPLTENVTHNLHSLFCDQLVNAWILKRWDKSRKMKTFWKAFVFYTLNVQNLSCNLLPVYHVFIASSNQLKPNWWD